MPQHMAMRAAWLCALAYLAAASLSSASRSRDYIKTAARAQAMGPYIEDDESGLIDLTVPIANGVVTWQNPRGLAMTFKSLDFDMQKGAESYSSRVNINVHTATHVDSPAHFIGREFEGGYTTDKIPLELLVGPAFVVEVPREFNITADVLKAMNIPHDCERLLFRTLNTARQLMAKREFVNDYTAVTVDGAEYLAQHTAVQLVGIDYLSIATFDAVRKGHVALFSKKPAPIIPVEGLDLTWVIPGRWYHLSCLPLLIPGAEGSPARCFAYGPDVEYEEERAEAELEQGRGWVSGQYEPEDKAEAEAAQHGEF